MTQFARTIVNLTGFNGAPGVNVYNWCNVAHADINQSAVNLFNEVLNDSLVALGASVFPSGVQWTIEPSVSVHEVDSGDLVNAYTDSGGPYTETGSGSGQENRATAIGLRWLTADFRFGRRVQGRTFLGPVASTVLDSNGDVAAAIRSGFPPAVSGMIDGSGPRLIVWSRPSTLHPTGTYADVTTCQVAQQPFLLGRRR